MSRLNHQSSYWNPNEIQPNPMKPPLSTSSESQQRSAFWSLEYCAVSGSLRGVPSLVCCQIAHKAGWKRIIKTMDLFIGILPDLTEFSGTCCQKAELVSMLHAGILATWKLEISINNMFSYLFRSFCTLGWCWFNLVHPSRCRLPAGFWTPSWSAYIGTCPLVWRHLRGTEEIGRFPLIATYQSETRTMNFLVGLGGLGKTIVKCSCWNVIG